MLRYYILPVFCTSFLCTIAGVSLEWRSFIIVLLFIGGVVLFQNRLLGAAIFMGVLFALLVFSLTYGEYLANSTADGQRVKVQAYVKQRELRSNNRQRITLITDIGTYQATMFRYPVVTKGDWVEIDCVLEVPKAFSGFNYPRYLSSQGIDALCQVISIHHLPQELPPSLLERGRISIAQRIKQLWPRPVSSLVAGLLLGTRESFSEGVLENFSRSGVTHIIALSGFNITILIVFIERLLTLVYTPRSIRTVLVVLGIFFFTIFVGAGASIMRAAIMGSIAYVLVYFGRASEIWRSLLLTATVMTIANPFVLIYDIGFQLSFLSTLGLVYLTPLFTRFFSWLPERFSFRESFVTTVSATLATLPLILLQFGVLSLVSPLANVLILPIIPWLMLTGFLSLFMPIVLPDLTTLGSRYVLLISEIFASPQWASQTVEISLVVFLLLLLLLGGAVYTHHLYEKHLN